MDFAILILCACNIFANMLVFTAIIAAIWLMLHKKGNKNEPKAPDTPKKQINEAERQRVEREMQRRAEEMNNFFSYTGDTQTKKGGD